MKIRKVVETGDLDKLKGTGSRNCVTIDVITSTMKLILLRYNMMTHGDIN